MCEENVFNLTIENINMPHLNRNREGHGVGADTFIK